MAHRQAMRGLMKRNGLTNTNHKAVDAKHADLPIGELPARPPARPLACLAYIVTAYIVTAYIVMAYIVMADIV